MLDAFRKAKSVEAGPPEKKLAMADALKNRRKNTPEISSSSNTWPERSCATFLRRTCPRNSC
eukprot:scaffold625_cov420-Prasinococcus_capsulatus_cf.AAC.27